MFYDSGSVKLDVLDEELHYVFLRISIVGKNTELFLMLFKQFDLQLTDHLYGFRENIEFIGDALQKLYFENKDRFLFLTLDRPGWRKLIFLHVLAKLDLNADMLGCLIV